MDGPLSLVSLTFTGAPFYNLTADPVLRTIGTCIVNASYRTLAIISRGLYFFYPFFTAAAAYTADN